MKKVFQAILVCTLLFSIGNAFATTKSSTVRQFMEAADSSLREIAGVPYDTIEIERSTIVGLIGYSFAVSDFPDKAYIAIMYDGDMNIWLLPTLDGLAFIMAVKEVFAEYNIIDGIIQIVDVDSLS